MSRLLSQRTPREKRLKKLTSKLSEGSSSVDLSGNPLTTSDLKKLFKAICNQGKQLRRLSSKAGIPSLNLTSNTTSSNGYALTIHLQRCHMDDIACKKISSLITDLPHAFNPKAELPSLSDVKRATQSSSSSSSSSPSILAMSIAASSPRPSPSSTLMEIERAFLLPFTIKLDLSHNKITTSGALLILQSLKTPSGVNVAEMTLQENAVNPEVLQWISDQTVINMTRRYHLETAPLKALLTPPQSSTPTIAADLTWGGGGSGEENKKKTGSRLSIPFPTSSSSSPSSSKPKSSGSRISVSGGGGEEVTLSTSPSPNPSPAITLVNPAPAFILSRTPTPLEVPLVETPKPHTTTPNPPSTPKTAVPSPSSKPSITVSTSSQTPSPSPSSSEKLPLSPKRQRHSSSSSSTSTSSSSATSPPTSSSGHKKSGSRRSSARIEEGAWLAFDTQAEVEVARAYVSKLIRKSEQLKAQITEMEGSLPKDVVAKVNRTKKDKKKKNKKKGSQIEETKVKTTGPSNPDIDGDPGTSRFKVVDIRTIQRGRRLAPLGGSGAHVFECEVDGYTCVVKELVNLRYLHPSVINGFQREMQILSSLPAHPNVCRYLFCRRTPDTLQLFMTRYDTNLSCIINSRYQQGVEDRLKYGEESNPSERPSHYFTPKEVLFYAKEIAGGLEFLHSHETVHRDIKCENIFAKLDASSNVKRLLVGDFDTAKIVLGTKPKTIVGTLSFMAPEIHRKGEYGKPADIYSFGVLLFVLLTQELPWGIDLCCWNYEERVSKPPVFPQCILDDDESEPLVSLCRQCVSLSVVDRPHATFLKRTLYRMDID